jgi:hydrogenase nickel incorporation protein HypB
MCTTCGCSEGAHPKLTDLDDRLTHSSEPVHEHGDSHEISHDHHGEHRHSHDPAHGHREGSNDDSAEVSHDPAHPHAQQAARRLRLEQDVLAKNDRLADRNRGWFEGRAILACNLMSSPGAGKTTLLERTIRDLGAEFPIFVIEGDQETIRDAERIRAAGCRVVQINTGAGCHLDAEMVAAAARKLDPPARSLVMIENVGNLVCPALFDLGEHARIVIMSVTEGEDKPLKYPHMFRASDVMVLSKVDLLPHVPFDVECCLDYARRVNPKLRVFQLSAIRNEGLAAWYSWLREEVAQHSTGSA